MQPDAKGPSTPHRNLKFINMILGGKIATFPQSWLQIVYLYSLAHFSITQGEFNLFIVDIDSMNAVVSC